jgi:nucleoside-diphosphate-sugar epimerase
MTPTLSDHEQIDRTSVAGVLAAGLSGQVGRGFAEAVGNDVTDSFAVTAVVRRRARSNLEQRGGMMTQVVGDVAAEFWTFDDIALDALGEIDVVVNLAGIVDWTASQADMDRVNYLGAMNGLALARRLSERLGRAVPYLYASTAYVAGTMSGSIPEDLHAPHEERTPYELSKWFAEHHLIREAAKDDFPVLISRIGGVIGSSTTRSTTRWSSLYQLVAPLSRGQLRVLPIRPGARVDILPRDVIGEGLVRLLSEGVRTGFDGWRGGAIVHLCAGEYAPTLEALFTVLQSKDIHHRYEPPRLLRTPDRTLRMAENVGLKYARWSREVGNRLYGLRYVSVDRIFERSRMLKLTDGWWPTTSMEEIVDIAFDLGHTEMPDGCPQLPMGRFA